jgi:hypothetical protein
LLLRAEVSGDASPGKYFRILLHGRGRKDPGFLAALQAVLGYSTIAVTERHGTVGDDLAKRKAPRLELGPIP